MLYQEGSRAVVLRSSRCIYTDVVQQVHNTWYTLVPTHTDWYMSRRRHSLLPCQALLLSAFAAVDACRALFQALVDTSNLKRQTKPAGKIAKSRTRYIKAPVRVSTYQVRKYWYTITRHSDGQSGKNMHVFVPRFNFYTRSIYEYTRTYDTCTPL